MLASADLRHQLSFQIAQRNLDHVVSLKSSAQSIELHSTRIRSGTAEHNLKAYLDLPAFDRGSELTSLALRCFNQAVKPNIRILHVGPRNVNEVLYTFSEGLNPANVFAVDLLPTHPAIVQADMHSIPTEDTYFDLVVVGWTLHYSSNPIAAIREFRRVLRPGGKLAIGWDGGVELSESKSDVLAHSVVNNLNELARLVRDSDPEFQPILSLERTQHLEGGFKRCMAVFTLDPGQDERVELLHTEIASCKSALASAPIHSILQIRISDHVELLTKNIYQRFITERITDEYLRMRQIAFQIGADSDDEISRIITRTFPVHQTLDSSVSPRNLTQESLRSVGYFVPTRTVSTSSCKKIRDFLDSRSHHDDSGRTLLNTTAMLESEEAISLWLDAEFLSVVESFFEAQPILASMYGSVTRHRKDASVGELSTDAQIFHADKDFVRFLKIFIYLNDVDISNGPHVYIPHSKKCTLGRDGRFSDADAQSFSPTISPVYIEGPEGTIIYGDTSCLHRGTNPSAGVRYMLTLEYTNSTAGRPEFFPKEPFYFRYGNIMKTRPRLFLLCK